MISQQNVGCIQNSEREEDNCREFQAHPDAAYLVDCLHLGHHAGGEFHLDSKLNHDGHLDEADLKLSVRCHIAGYKPDIIGFFCHSILCDKLAEFLNHAQDSESVERVKVSDFMFVVEKEILMIM